MEKITISRSFSQKIKIGDFLTADFFASAQAETSPTEKDKVSQELFDFVKKEVEESIDEYKKGKKIAWSPEEQENWNKNSQLRDINATLGI